MQNALKLAELTLAINFFSLGATFAATGNAIAFGETANGTILVGGTNLYSFTAAVKDVVTIQLVGGGANNTYPMLELQGPDGAVVGTASAFIPGSGNSGVWAYLDGKRLTNAGTYLILVRDNEGNQTYPYGLTLVKNPGPNDADDGGTILPGQTVTNSLSVLGDIDVYSFTAAVNDVVTIQLVGGGANNTYPMLEVQGPDGAVVGTASAFIPGSGNSGVWAYLDGKRLTNAGTYLILVRDSEGNQTYPYGLTLVKNPGPNDADDGGTILPGQTVTNSLSVLGDIDVYSFTAAVNDMVTIQLVGGGANNTYPMLELQGPDGAVVGRASAFIPGSGNSGVWAYLDGKRLTNAGTYLILVRDSEGNQTYPYGLTLVKNPGPNDADDGGTILPGQTVTNSLSVLGDIDVYSFTAAVNDVVTIQLVGGGANNTYPMLELQGPDGAVVGRASAFIPGSGNSGVWAYLDGKRLTNAGTYLILVRDSEGNQTYPYGLTLVKNPGPNLVDVGEGSFALAPFETRFGAIGFADMDGFSFRAIAGDSINISLKVTSGGAVSPVLELQAPDGSIVTSSSRPSSAHIAECVQQTGNFVILVRDNEGNSVFGYELSFSQSPIIPSSSGSTQYLAIFECTNHVTVRWETNSLGFRLESSPVLPATNWLRESQIPITVIADHFYFTESATNTAKFYRLVCSDCPPALATP